MAHNHPYQTSDKVAYQSGYQAGYDAGFRAGFEAATRSPASQQQQQQQQEQYLPSQQHQPHDFEPQPRPSDNSQAPQLPHRPRPPIPPRPTAQPTPIPSSAPPPPQPPTTQPPKIWRPSPRTTFNYILSHPPPSTYPFSTYQVYILDLFDTPTATITAIHAANSRAIAYFSAGSWEDWRPDASHFLTGPRGKKVLGKPLDGWKGERWVDVRDANVRSVLGKRVELARTRGFDGVDPDNVDGWENENGLGLGRGDAVEVVRWLSGEAHGRGLACGLKNGSGIVREVLGEVEFVVVEEAVRYKETKEYMCVVESGKPVFHVEYPKGDDAESEKCNNEKRVEGRKAVEALRMREKGWSSIIKNVRLDAWVQTDC